MPRAPRLHIENAVYFVTLEGPHREALFKDHADYAKYVNLLKTYRAEFGFSLFAFTLLPNRLCLVLEPRSEEFSISQIMQRISPVYTKYFNERYDRKGPLFQKRFRSVIVEKQGYLARLARYLYWLPVKSGYADTLGEYPYSSCGSMISLTTGTGDVLLDLTAEAKELLNMISPKPLAAYLGEGGAEEFKFFDQKLSRGFVLGSEAFVKDARERRRQNAVKPEHEVEPEIVRTARAGFLDSIRRITVPAFGALALTVAGASTLIYIKNVQKPPAPATEHPSVIPEGRRPIRNPVWIPASAGMTTGVSERLPHPNPNTPRLPASIQMPDLNGTVWKIELISVAPDGKETPIEDKIQFVGPAFESYYFSNQGFSKSNYTVRIQKNGTITWETMQRNAKGETISWRGDWQGDRMEGVLSYKPDGGTQQAFSFISRAAGVQK